MHVYTVFALYSPFYSLSPHPPFSHWYQFPLPTPNRTCPALLLFDFVKNKKKKKKERKEKRKK
jgi:hypothetical protein